MHPSSGELNSNVKTETKICDKEEMGRREICCCWSHQRVQRWDSHC